LSTSRAGTARASPWELVVFDCDGVLVDSEPISNGVLAEMLGEQGWQLTLAETRAIFQGMLLTDIRAAAERELGRALPADWIEQYVARRAAVFDAELQPVPGAAELVERVAGAGIDVCIASQGSLAKIARSLALTGLERLFPPQSRFSAYDIPRGKPAPDLFLHAAASSGVEPSRCAVVEDTPSGVVAAVAAGMAVYGLTADSDERALREAGARTAPTLQQIGDLLLAAPVDS
jgi:HAD superfamily hydrolase (TIGR01509 family)